MAIGLFAIISLPAFAAQTTGISISTTVKAVNTAGYGTYMDAVEDGSGNIHLITKGIGMDTKSIYYYKYNGTSWSTPAKTWFTSDDDLQGDPRIDVDSNGNPLIVWMVNDIANNYHVPYYVFSDDGGASFPPNATQFFAIESALSGEDSNIDVAFDSVDAPHVVISQAGLVSSTPTNMNQSLLYIQGFNDFATSPGFFTHSAKATTTNPTTIGLEITGDLSLGIPYSGEDQLHIIMGARAIDTDSDNLSYIQFTRTANDPSIDQAWGNEEEISGLNAIQQNSIPHEFYTAVDSADNVSFAVIDNQPGAGTDTVYLAERSSVDGTWDIDTVSTGVGLEGSIPALTTYGAVEYVAIGAKDLDWEAYLYQKVSGTVTKIEGDIPTHDHIAASNAANMGTFHFEIDPAGASWTSPFPDDTDPGNAYHRNYVLTSAGTKIAFITAWQAPSPPPPPEDPPPGDGAACTGTPNADGYTYTMSFHAYSYGGNDYDDFWEIGEGGVGLLWDNSAESPLYEHYEETDISCAINATGGGDYDWHMVLITGTLIDAGGTARFPMYMNANDYNAVDDAGVKTAFEAVMNAGGEGTENYLMAFDFESYTTDYWKYNAFTGSAGSYDPLNTQIAIDGVVKLTGENGANPTDTYQTPAITVSGGGQSVPEFADYILIITIGLALGLAYKVIPRTKPTAA